MRPAQTAAALAFSLAALTSANANPLAEDANPLAETATQWVAVTVSETLCQHGTPALMETMRRDLAVALSEELEDDVDQARFDAGVDDVVRVVLEHASMVIANVDADQVDCAKGKAFVNEQVRAAHDRADHPLKVKIDSTSLVGPRI